MRPPLDKMLLRSGDIEEGMKGMKLDGIKSLLNSSASPLGGDFGKVRSYGHKNHQGWDLYAAVGTPVYAVTDGVVHHITSHGDYGLQLCMLLSGEDVIALNKRLGITHLYAFYAHLSATFVEKKYEAKQGVILGLSGNTGNAVNVIPHLHFELRAEPHLGKGLAGRFNPGILLGFQYYQCYA